MIVCGAGPYPHQLTVGPEPGSALTHAQVRFIDDWLERKEISRVVSGMAAGWDHALALAAVARGVPLTAAVPYFGYEASWPPDAQDMFHQILEMAEDVVFVGDPCAPDAARQARNRWMVERSDRVLALWDGQPGGTADCVACARAAGKPVDNLWSRWRLRFATEPSRP